MNELKNELGKKMNNKYLIFNPGEVGSPQKLDIPTSFAYIYISIIISMVIQKFVVCYHQ